ncbi:MAG: GC-type dockerin domain-anchored protein [Planctomycetota bacterium]
MKAINAPACLLAALLTSATYASSAQQTVIFSNIAGEPSSQIPGGVGTWDADFSFFTLNISTSGEHWLFNHQASGGFPEVLVAGSGTTGSVVLQEGLNQLNGRIVEGIDSSGRINNSGAWVVAGDFSGATSDDDFVVSGDLSGVNMLLAQEGSAIPDSIFGAGNTYDTLQTTAIDQSGLIYHEADSLDGPAFGSDDNEAIIRSDGVVLLRTATDIPTNQGGGTARTYQGFDLDDFHVSDDGSSWLVRGDFDGSSADDDALFVDGMTVIQEGFTLSDIGILNAESLTAVVDNLTGGIDQQFMAGNGDWYAFGQVADGNDTDWAIRNGAVIARSGDEIFPGAGESWDDPASGIQDFSLLVGNSLGDYVLGGLTSQGDVVVVLNGAEVVLRSGDAVDLDGDGTSDDAFIGSFEFQETRLGDNLMLFALVNLDNASGADIGSAFITVDLAACPADLAEPLGTLNFFDIAEYIALFNAGDPVADFAAPFGAINFFDIAEYINQFNAGCP